MNAYWLILIALELEDTELNYQVTPKGKEEKKKDFSHLQFGHVAHYET